MIYSSQQRRTINAPDLEQPQTPYRSHKPARDHSYVGLRDSQHARRAPLMLPADSTRFVEFQQPRETREVQYITANDEPPHQRHQSERVLPSVEADDFDTKEPAHAPRHENSQYWDTSLHDMNAYRRSQYPLRSAVEPRNHIDYPNLKRARDDDQVYMVSERPRRPLTYDDRDRIMVVPVDGHAPDKIVHQQATESIYDNVPGTVEYDSRIVQLPPRASEQNTNSDWQVHPEFRPKHDKHGRSLDLSHGQESVVPRESRRASYAQPGQHMLLPESYRAVDASPSYSTAPKRAPAFQPSISRIVRMESAGDGRFVMPAEDPGQKVQPYDEHGRMIRNDVLPRRESAVYAPSRRAIG